MLDVLLTVVVACLMLLYVMMVCVWTDILKMKPETLVFNVLLVANGALLPVLKVVKLVGIHLLVLLLIVLVLMDMKEMLPLICVCKSQNQIQFLKMEKLL